MMDTKIIKVSDKGQISIPLDIREACGIHKGDELIVVKSGSSIVLEKVKEFRFHDLLKHSEKVAEKVWANKSDEVWNDV